ncbi:hypothetical protein HHK36_032669 [Tetracentron sinense]|uniref:Uncharacterized protein n=1 Tax=Tetracentron sinense TaxID=13715 RepID=A0A835CZC2_TETSI|nr:hypothetical protein HHK36_032669 [Tetracentron sinense]
MASLATRLFEVSPHRSLWLASFLGSLPNFLPSQTLTPTPLESSPSSTKEILSLFTSLQTQLFEAVAELQEILDLQDAKQKITREIRSKDSSILAFANKLKEAERVLDLLVDDYSDYHRPKRSKYEGVQSNSQAFSYPAIPRFDGHYDHWSMLMENFLRSKEYWTVVVSGVAEPAEGAVQTDAQKTELEGMKLKDLKAKNYLFQAIDRSILETILCKDTAKHI